MLTLMLTRARGAPLGCLLSKGEKARNGKRRGSLLRRSSSPPPLPRPAAAAEDAEGHGDDVDAGPADGEVEEEEDEEGGDRPKKGVCPRDRAGGVGGPLSGRLRYESAVQVADRGDEADGVLHHPPHRDLPRRSEAEGAAPRVGRLDPGRVGVHRPADRVEGQVVERLR